MVEFYIPWSQIVGLFWAKTLRNL